MNKRQATNLMKLHNFLKAYDLGDQWDMGTWTNSIYHEDEEDEEHGPRFLGCGTVGCAIGWYCGTVNPNGSLFIDSDGAPDFKLKSNNYSLNENSYEYVDCIRYNESEDEDEGSDRPISVHFGITNAEEDYLFIPDTYKVNYITQSMVAKRIIEVIHRYYPEMKPSDVPTPKLKKKQEIIVNVEPRKVS